MKKFAFAFAALALSTGCAFYKNVNPSVGVNNFDFEKWKKGTDYELVGDTQGQACTTKLLGIQIEPFLEEKTGTLGGGSASQAGSNALDALFGKLLGGESSAVGAATYNAIEAFKGADFVLPTRSKSDKTDYIVFARECATVTGKAVRIKL